MKLKIDRNPKWEGKGKPLTGIAYRYRLQMEEGETPFDITHGLTSLELTMGARDINHVTLGFMLDEVDVDVDVLAELEAYVARKGEEEEPEEVRPCDVEVGNAPCELQAGHEGDHKNEEMLQEEEEARRRSDTVCGKPILGGTCIKPEGHAAACLPES